MSQVISKWGNSLAVRLPKSALDAANLHEGDVVTVVPAADGLILRRSHRVDLDSMIAGITNESLPDPLDEPPFGRELL